MLGDEFVFGGGFVVVEPGDEFVELSIGIELGVVKSIINSIELILKRIKSIIHSPHDDIEFVIELSRSICCDMLMMVWHDVIDVLGVGMLDNCSSGISSTNVR